MPAGGGFCKAIATLGIIKQCKSSLCSTLNALYFYIINNGSTVSEGRKRRKSYQKRKASPQQDFYLFFIWQAIVRGQLFLQWTFFLLYTYHLMLHFELVYYPVPSCINSPAIINKNGAYAGWMQVLQIYSAVRHNKTVTNCVM